MNIFSILGVVTREDVNTNLLIFAFNNSSRFRCHVLNKIDTKLLAPEITWQAYPRVGLAGIGVPDVVIVGKDENTGYLILIENKLTAEEGDNQTARYASPDSVQALKNRFFEKEPKEVYSYFLFLTLFPDISVGSDDFRPISHRELFSDFEIINPDQLQEKLIADWKSIINPFYAREQLAEQVGISDMLQDDNGLDAGFLYFRKMMHNVMLPAEIWGAGCWRDSRQGRKYYGAQFSKDRWQTKEMYEQHEKWQFDGRNYDIHIEPQYNVLNGNLAVFLHYEMSPYEPEAWARKNMDAACLTRYLENRLKFVDLLTARQVPGLAMGGGWNQIAKLSMDFSKVTTRQAMDYIADAFTSISSAVDSVLAELR